MRIYTALAEIPEPLFREGSAIAIGKFDGVHLGHRTLIDRIAHVASEQHLEAVVFTFANNPLSLLRPEICPAPIMSRQQRIEALADAGAETCVMLPFDEELAAVSAERFVADILVGLLRVKHLCVGNDFRFGHRGAGDVALLTKLGAEYGFVVEVIGSVEDPVFGRVSSSRVREAIAQGDLHAVTRMLGRELTIRGTVVHGDARGRDLGFPTANLGGEVEGLRPGEGVYAGWVVVRGERHPAAISVGANVTFDPAGEPRVEAFLIDFAGDLYDEPVEVCFVQRLRGMIAFANVDALIAQMHADVREAREILLALA